MIRKLIPVLLGLIGLGIGAGTGIFLRPAAKTPTEVVEGEAEHAAPADREAAHGEAAKAEHTSEPSKTETAEGGPEYVKMTNQFVIPVVDKGRVVSMVILALTLEVAAGTTEAVYAREPKLRDAFLQVLFDHANSGGFDGSFTDGANLVLLRRALLEAAQTAIGPNVSDVLISDIARQDS